MISLIMAMTMSGGIGIRNKLPWQSKEELALFRKLTYGKTLVMGRRTLETLPYLEGRKIICLTRQDPDEIDTSQWKNKPSEFISSITEVYGRDVMIAGGSEVYDSAFQSGLVVRIYQSIMKGDYECDTHVSLNWHKYYVVETRSEYESFTHYVWRSKTTYDKT